MSIFQNFYINITYMIAMCTHWYEPEADIAEVDRQVLVLLTEVLHAIKDVLLRIFLKDRQVDRTIPKISGHT